jgi:hypothetical protein
MVIRKTFDWKKKSSSRRAKFYSHGKSTNNDEENCDTEVTKRKLNQHSKSGRNEYDQPYETFSSPCPTVMILSSSEAK